MIFEIKNYQKSKQYKINGAVVRKSIFKSAQELEKENAALESQIKTLKKGVGMRADRLLFINKENAELKEIIKNLRSELYKNEDLLDWGFIYKELHKLKEQDDE